MKCVVFNTIYSGMLSNSAKSVSKKIWHYSYYKALDLLIFIPNLVERNFILQALRSAASYLQNNYDVDLMKLSVDSIIIQKDKKTSKLIRLSKTTQYLPFFCHISIKLVWTVSS